MRRICNKEAPPFCYIYGAYIDNVFSIISNLLLILQEFYDCLFNFLGEVNSTLLDSERNEVVVHLPPSVSDASRRVSFVVFRNDRAFQASQGSYSVNSRVLSIKVENITNFENGEVR